MPVLHHRTITARGAAPERWALVLAGIFGRGRNWASVAKALADVRPDWGFVLVDLRGHGESPTPPPPHTLEACAADLAETADDMGIEPAALIGHSFGGKVALAYASARAEAGLVSPTRPLHIWVVDSTPSSWPPGGSVWKMVGVLRDHPGPFPERSAGIAAVEAQGYPNPVAQWMATNLVHDGAGGLVWRLDPDVMEALLKDFFATDLLPLATSPPPGVRLDFIRASDSTVLDEPTRTALEEAADGAVRLHTVTGGHWLNADNPEALVELIAEGLS